MHQIRTTLVAAATVAATLAAFTLPAGAAHVHYVATPNGKCHQVAAGQTSISDPDHGGYHRYHEHVHLGATGATGTDGDDNLGNGNGAAKVYKHGPAPAVCDGSA